MSLFDFLKGGGGMDIHPGQIAPGSTDQVSGGLLQAPTATPKPGLFERMRAPDESGVSFSDKLYAAGSELSGEGGMEYLQNKRKDHKAQQLLEQTKADRAQKNAAFKAAYQNGKFDPGVYASGLGDSEVDPADIASLQKAFAPHAGVDGGYSYTQDPTTGETTWGPQRQQSYSEQAAIAREAEAERRNQEIEAIARGRLGVAQAGEHRRAAQPQGGQSWLPPGARVVHVPGQ